MFYCTKFGRIGTSLLCYIYLFIYLFLFLILINFFSFLNLKKLGGFWPVWVFFFEGILDFGWEGETQKKLIFFLIKDNLNIKN